jgi:hypothetical protein
VYQRLYEALSISPQHDHGAVLEPPPGRGRPSWPSGAKEERLEHLSFTLWCLALVSRTPGETILTTGNLINISYRRFVVVYMTLLLAIQPRVGATQGKAKAT